MGDAHKNSTARTALENIRKRLLDLTARNRLINFRHTKGSSLRVIDELPNQLAEMMMAEKEMRFLPVPEPTSDQLIQASYIAIDEKTGQEIRLKKDPSAEEWARWLGLETSYEVPISSSEESEERHADKAIQTLLFPYELETRLRSLRQKANSAIEETGTNILYLAIGFLEWFESTNIENRRIAPLFLIPAKLEKGRLNRTTNTYEYTLTYSGEDIITNLSLREKLRLDFALALPELDENTMPEDYLEAVQDLLRKNPLQWQLRRYITITLLNFKKLLMYLDLDANNWPEDKCITDHTIVTRFLAGYSGEAEESEREPELGFGEEYAIDEIADVHKKFPLIDDADSSQHSALIDALEGKNLVIEGPPGTGKSQTITNLIAAAMSQGKKVLFVAEKLAALEVVKRRLDAAGLGEFCLELHSHKSQKRKILDEVGLRLNKRGKYRNPKDIDADIARYEELKESLKNYADLINRSWKNTGKTLNEIFMSATRFRQALNINPETVHPDGYDGNNFDAANQRRLRDQALAFGDMYVAVTKQIDDNISLRSHPWFGVRNPDLQIFDIDQVRNALEQWQKSLRELMALGPKLALNLACKDSEIPQTVSGLEAFLIDLECLPKLKSDELLDRLPVLHGNVLINVKKYLKLFEYIQSMYASLAEKIKPEVLSNLDSVDSFLRGGKQLSQIVGKNIELSKLTEAIQRLIRLHNKLEEIREPVSEIQAAISERAANHLKLSESGIRELKMFINAVAALQPTYWKLRDNLFDNDELDQMLPKMRRELEALHTMQYRLKDVYDLGDGFPSQSILGDLQLALSTGGAFRWFKGSWRSARKRLLGHAANPHVKLNEMMALLNKAIAFAEGLHRLEQNQSYKELIGKHAKGIATDLASLEAIRHWYRRVRQIYGFGFGPKVALGNAIIDMHADLARLIRSMAERGITRQLGSILDELSSLKTIFEPVQKMQNGRAILVGETGLLAIILSALNNALRVCGPLVTDNTISLKELLRRIENLNSLRNRARVWIKADYDSRLFQGRLGLKIGLGANNQIALSRAHHTVEVADCLRNKITSPLIKQRIYEAPDKSTFESLYRIGQLLRKSTDKQTNKFSAFEALVKLDREAWTNTCGDEIAKLMERNADALSHERTLQNWLDYVRVREQLAILGLNKLANEVEKGAIKVNHVEDAYCAGIYDLLAREILREQTDLGRFSGRNQESLQRQFKEYDNKLKKLQCERISWQLDQTKVPRGKYKGKVSEYTELHLLEHELGKKKRHIPLRQLIKRASSALVVLKPCFMMGPMSVAQYIEPGRIDFDMVVMDEASQIKPEDALGAIARGSQLVVVGDPKQLPPTSFFDRVVYDEEDDPTAIEESESILDATLPIFTARRLRWHYRSQHQSLIAFSNHFFYNSDLVLFPSSLNESESLGVKFSRVRRGCFINRRNLQEANIISEAVRKHFQHRSDETLGVVAMSAEQRDQIERSVETLAKDDFTFQEWLEKVQLRQEPLFIKNLENVQGDERDVILISMTYGPNELGGKVYQRFGPINSDVGWRRLNVLFTRARKRMHVFSSMGSEDIVVGINSRRGVKAMRDFLAYCETGLIHHTEGGTLREPDSDFEIAVAEALRDEGFECIAQVGVAGFFIDIAIVDPGNPGRYLMGIECDGATYHSAKSVRDRDRLRQEILVRLGWRIRRIWSTDWFKNPIAELNPIIRELHNLKTEPVEKREVEYEVDEIDEIIEKDDQQEEFDDQFISKGNGLQEKLIRFNNEVIKKELPDTPNNQRLLRPAMLEAFLEYSPTSKPEFLEYIPSYLRQSTKSNEGKFLNNVLEIINSALE